MIDQINSKFKLTKPVVMPPMQSCKASGKAKLSCLSKRVNVAGEDFFSLSKN